MARFHTLKRSLCLPLPRWAGGAGMSWTSAAQTQVQERLPTPPGRVAPRRAWPAVRQITRESPGDGAPQRDPQTLPPRKTQSAPLPPLLAQAHAPSSRSALGRPARLPCCLRREFQGREGQMRRQETADWQTDDCGRPGCPVQDRHQRAGPPRSPPTPPPNPDTPIRGHPHTHLKHRCFQAFDGALPGAPVSL